MVGDAAEEAVFLVIPAPPRPDRAWRGLFIELRDDILATVLIDDPLAGSLLIRQDMIDPLYLGSSPGVDVRMMRAAHDIGFGLSYHVPLG